MGDQPGNAVMLALLDHLGDGGALGRQPLDPRRLSAELGTCGALGRPYLRVKAVATVEASSRNKMAWECPTFTCCQA